MVKRRKRGPTRAQKIAEAKRLVAASKVFLEFHENTSWAYDKLHSGTAQLNAESVKYMEQVIARRKDNAAHELELAEQNKAADLAAKVQANREADL